ncbi:MAG: dodecin family protein [Gaiellaceae bacterium]
MSVVKVVQIIGSSPESFAKAAANAVEEAAKTLRNITGADVVSMTTEVEDGVITEYRVTMNIAFVLERPAHGATFEGDS